MAFNFNSLVEGYKKKFSPVISPLQDQQRLSQASIGNKIMVTLGNSSIGKGVINLQKGIENRTLPRVNLQQYTQKIKAPVPRIGAQLGAGLAENMINLPQRLLEGGGKAGLDIRTLRSGGKLTPTRVIGTAASIADPLLDIATLGGGTVAKNIAKQGGKQIAKQSLKQAVKTGVFKGVGAGALYGGLYGLSEGDEAQLGNLLRGAGIGAAFGGVVGGVSAGLGGVVGKLAEAYKKHHPNASPKEITKGLRTFIQDETTGKLLGSKKKAPVFYMDLRESLGLDPKGDYSLPVGLQAKPIGGTKGILEAEELKALIQKQELKAREIQSLGPLANGDTKATSFETPYKTEASKVFSERQFGTVSTKENLGTVKSSLPESISQLPIDDALAKTSTLRSTRVSPLKVSPTGTDTVQMRPLAKSPIPSQETLESAAQTQKLQKVNSGQLPPETPSLPDIINKEAIDVKQKVNLFDYIRTPDRVMKKIGLEPESQLLRKKYNDYLDELPQQINKVTQWSKEVSPESNQRIFQFLDGKKVELDQNETRVAGEIRQYLQKWADRLKLPQERRITNYITHIFDQDFIKKEFDPEMAKILENRVAGSVYDPFVEQRLGKLGYKQDTWAALDAYVKRATRKVNMDDALGQIKKKAESLELSQYKYVKQYTDRINMRPTDVDNLLDNTLKSVFGYKFGVRPTSYLSRKGRQAVYRGTLGLNVGSAVKNLTQGANTYARLGEKYTILGYAKNALKMASGDDELTRVGVLRDDFIQDRTINATKKFWEKVDKGLFMFFEVAEKINRGSAYFGAKAQAIDKGLNEKQAIEYALKTVRDTQFTFGSIDTPPILSSDLSKLLLQFQSFTLKQGEFLGEMVSKKDLAGLARYGLASALLTTTMGKLIGMEWKDFIPSLRIGLPPTIQAPVEIGKAIVGVPDKYGNAPDLEERLQNIGNTLVPFIPGGVQLKKTIGGLSDVNKGYAETTKGNVKAPLGQDTGNFIKAGLFGTNKLPEMQEYYAQKLSPLSEKQSEIFKAGGGEGYYNEVLSERDKNKEIESIKTGLPKESSQVGENIYQLSDGTAVAKIGKDWKTYDTPEEAQSKQNIYNFEQLYGEYDYKSAEWSLTVDRLKRADDFSGWVDKAQEYAKYLTDYIQQVDPNSKEFLTVTNKIEDLAIQIAKYQGYGGFTKGKKKAKPSIKKVSMKKVSTPKIQKISIPAPRYRKIKNYTLSVATVKRPKIIVPKLSKWEAKSSGKFTRVK